MFLVAKTFVDLQDNCNVCEVGQEYPRKGYEPTPERIAELASGANLAGEPLIVEVKDEAPKKSGGRKKASK